MTYKMIVLDLDDTLLQSDGSISTKTKETLKRAQRIGVKVVLASGRPTFAILKIANELELKKFGGFIISFNGARIFDCKFQKDLYAANITQNNIWELYDLSKKFNAYIQTYIGDNIIASQKNKFTDIERQITGMDIIVPDNFKNYVSQDVVKAIVMQEPEKLKAIDAKIRPFVNGIMYMTISKPFFLEFMNVSVIKS